MSDQAGSTTDVQDQADEKAEDQRVPYERFQQANKKAKEAADRASALEADLAALKASLEERDQAGLPDLERERKRAEQLEKRAADAEKRADETERNLVRSTRSSLVTAAAAKAGFDDPTDALRFSEYVDLDDIENDADAERAVKKLAKAKPRLLKEQDTKLPGRVLENGQAVDRAVDPAVRVMEQDTQVVVDGLKEFLARRAR